MQKGVFFYEIHDSHEWPQVPLHPCIPYSLLIHTSLYLPCAPPRQGQGAVVQVPAESLIIPPAFLLRGRAACSGENLFKDRCAYQTPVLRPTPCGFHNYLLVRLPRHSSKTALNPSDSSSYTSCQWARLHRGQVGAQPTDAFLSPSLSATHHQASYIHLNMLEEI